MNINVEQKDEKYFSFIDKDNNNFRIFLRSNKNKTPSFSLCIIEEISSTKSICYKKTFLVEEFNYYVEGYKKFENIEDIQQELISNIKKGCIQINQLDESTKLVKIILNNSFQLSIKLNKVHIIFESNDIERISKQQVEEINFTKNMISKISSNLQKCEEDNKNNDVNLNNLKNKASKLYDIFYQFKKNQKSQIPKQINNQGPSEEVMLTLTKEERYRILGIKSDIVHTLQELFYLSRCLSQEKATKLDLLFKGPYQNFSAIIYHSSLDNIVPCLILVETDKGARFGGFTNQTWKGENIYKKDPTAFLFSLNYLEKYPVRQDCVSNAIFVKGDHLFSFGRGDLIIYDQCNRKYCKSEFPRSYMCLNNQVDPRYRLTKYYNEFVVKDLEVFLVSFETKNF
jgi:hypothetical protein